MRSNLHWSDSIPDSSLLNDGAVTAEWADSCVKWRGLSQHRGFQIQLPTRLPKMYYIHLITAYAQVRFYYWYVNVLFFTQTWLRVHQSWLRISIKANILAAINAVREVWCYTTVNFFSPRSQWKVWVLRSSWVSYYTTMQRLQTEWRKRTAVIICSSWICCLSVQMWHVGGTHQFSFECIMPHQDYSSLLVLLQNLCECFLLHKYSLNKPIFHSHTSQFFQYFRCQDSSGPTFDTFISQTDGYWMHNVDVK